MTHKTNNLSQICTRYFNKYFKLNVGAYFWPQKTGKLSSSAGQDFGHVWPFLPFDPHGLTAPLSCNSQKTRFLSDVFSYVKTFLDISLNCVIVFMAIYWEIHSACGHVNKWSETVLQSFFVQLIWIFLQSLFCLMLSTIYAFEKKVVFPFKQRGQEHFGQEEKSKVPGGENTCPALHLKWILSIRGKAIFLLREDISHVERKYEYKLFKYTILKRLLTINNLDFTN